MQCINYDWEKVKKCSYSAELATFLKELASLQVFPLSCKVQSDALVVLLRRLRTWTIFINVDLAAARQRVMVMNPSLTDDVCVHLHLSVLLSQLERFIVAVGQNQEVNG